MREKEKERQTQERRKNHGFSCTDKEVAREKETERDSQERRENNRTDYNGSEREIFMIRGRQREGGKDTDMLSLTKETLIILNCM